MKHQNPKTGKVIITLPMHFDAQMLERMDELSYQCGLRDRIEYLNQAHRFLSFHIDQSRRGNKSALLILPQQEVLALEFEPLEFARTHPNRTY